MSALSTTPPPSSTPPQPTINTRIRDADGFLGTILYIGPVSSAKNQSETYYGIEWDDETRGKHDGSCVSKSTNEIVRHFKCRFKREGGSCLTAGSFVKVGSNKLDFGVDFATVLQTRYVQLDAPLIAPDNKFMGCVAMTKNGRSKQIEFFGELKIRTRQQVDVIDSVALRNEGVSHAGENYTAIQEYAGHLNEVDLQGNMLADWGEVGKIMTQLPALETLHLNSNKLNNPPKPFPQSFADIISNGGFLNLTTLVLNGIGLDGWNSVGMFSTVFPNLEELYLANNNFSDISLICSETNDKTVGFKNLILLDLSGCNITSWDQVETLSELRNLKMLILNDNQIHSISPNGDDNKDFVELQGLQINNTLIDSWSSIDNLQSFPKLISLRFGKCPITLNLGASEARSIAIARVKSLSFFNASVVSGKERVEAEKGYLRRIAREMTMACSLVPEDTKTVATLEEKKNEVIAKHPRFHAIMSLHGAGMVPSGDASSSGSIINDTVNVTIKSMASASCMNEPMSKRLPSTLLISRLKQMCKKTFKLDVDLQVLHYKADKDDGFMTPLDDDDNTLGYYGVMDGTEIYMNEIDVKALKREKEKEEKEREERRRVEEEGGETRREHLRMEVMKEKKGVASAAR